MSEHWVHGLHPVFFCTLAKQCCIYYGRGRGVYSMCHGGGKNWLIGIFAISMGTGIFIAAIFPAGLLMFLVATLLIACGCACCKR